MIKSNQNISENKIIRFIIKMDKMMQNVLKVICGTLLSCVVILVFMQVVLRTGFKFSFRWVEEVTRWLNIGAALSGAALAYRYSELAGVTSVIERFSEKVQVIAKYLCNILISTFSVVILYSSYKLIKMIVEYNQLSAASRLPMWIGYATIPFSTTAILIFSIHIIIFSIFKVEVDNTTYETGEAK